MLRRFLLISLLLFGFTVSCAGMTPEELNKFTTAHRQIWEIGGDCKHAAVYVCDMAAALDKSCVLATLETSMPCLFCKKKNSKILHVLPMVFDAVTENFFYIDTHKYNGAYRTVVKTSTELWINPREFNQILPKGTPVRFTKFLGILHEKTEKRVRMLLYDLLWKKKTCTKR